VAVGARIGAGNLSCTLNVGGALASAVRATSCHGECAYALLGVEVAEFRRDALELRFHRIEKLMVFGRVTAEKLQSACLS
jgi:hypothetical protein